MNKVCVMKLGWKLLIRSKEMRCKVLSNKYKCTNNFLEVQQYRGTGSSLWKDIVKILPQLLNTGYWSIRDGKDIDAQNDIQMDNGRCISRYNLKILEDLDEAKLRELVNDNGVWN